MARFIVCVAALALARPATACLNDNELPAHEREFRSEYVRGFIAPAATPRAPSFWLPAGIGTALLIGACAFAARAGRAKG
jgi:hypothetical protein